MTDNLMTWLFYSTARVCIVDNSPPLATAKRIRAETSTFDEPPHKLLQSVIEYSTFPQMMARQFLVELAKWEIMVKNLGDVPLLSYLMSGFIPKLSFRVRASRS
jgi:hypothetical protein